MTITTTILRRTVFGNQDIVYGKSVLSGDVATADVVTGLNRIDMFKMNIQGSSAKACSVNETFPLVGGDVTAVTESNNLTFYWSASGK